MLHCACAHDVLHAHAFLICRLEEKLRGSSFGINRSLKHSKSRGCNCICYITNTSHVRDRWILQAEKCGGIDKLHVLASLLCQVERNIIRCIMLFTLCVSCWRLKWNKKLSLQAWLCGYCEIVFCNIIVICIGVLRAFAMCKINIEFTNIS